MALDEKAIIELGRAALSGDSPAGRDVADDEDFLALEAELVKLDRIDLGEPDYRLIEDAALNILRSKSKDVHVAYALGLALFHSERYAGLAAVLGMLVEMVIGFWDQLFPQRPRRRKARIEALGEFLVDRGWLAGEGLPRPDEFDALDRCVERLEKLKSALTEKMPDEPLDVGKFARRLKELAATRPKAAEAPPAAAAAPAAAGGGATAAPAGAFVAGEIQDVSGAMKAILAAATFLRQADATNPVPYAIARLMKWARIELPPEPARRQIEPPEKSLVEALAHQFGKGLWEPLLGTAEGAFRANDPLWLDLQRYVCSAMQGLGPPFERARTIIMDLTGALVRRLGPGVYDLTFRNGTPLCDGPTRMWLETEVCRPAEGGAGGGAAGNDGKLNEAWEEARKLAAGGKLTDAVKALQDGVLTCVQRRDRFLWRLRMAQLCLDAKRLQLAAPLLEECAEEVRRHRIDEWEPALAAEVAQALYRCRKALVAGEKQPTPEVLSRVQDSFAWLCQLDPLAALAVEPSA